MTAICSGPLGGQRRRRRLPAVRRGAGPAAVLAALFLTGAPEAQAQFTPPRVASCNKTIGGPLPWSGLHSCLGIEVEARITHQSIPRPPIQPVHIMLYEMRARLRLQPGTLLAAGVSVLESSACTFRVTSSQWTAWAVCKGGVSPVPAPTLRMSGSWLVY